LWLNGQQLSNLSPGDSSGPTFGLTGLFLKAVNSVKSWWSGSNGTVRVWVQGQPSNSQTAGVVKMKTTPAQTHMHSVTHPKAPAITRPWQTFAASHRLR
jgi:hypothetical protein